MLARRAITEADLQTAGRGSRPGFIDDLHRRVPGPGRALRAVLSHLSGLEQHLLLRGRLGVRPRPAAGRALSSQTSPQRQRGDQDIKAEEEGGDGL